jgi:hypothetical protein
MMLQVYLKELVNTMRMLFSSIEIEKLQNHGFFLVRTIRLCDIRFSL